MYFQRKKCHEIRPNSVSVLVRFYSVHVLPCKLDIYAAFTSPFPYKVVPGD